MFLLLRVLWTFIISVFFLGVVFSNFLSDQNYANSPDLLFLDSSIDDFESGTWITITLSEGSIFEKIFSTVGEIWIQESEERDILDISRPWKYYTSLRDLQKSYSLEWQGFSIIQEGTGEIFIDSESQDWKVLVLAVSTPVTLQLKSEDNSELYTEVFLAPHMYLLFEPSRWSFLKNADAIRVQTIHHLDYVTANISNFDTDTVLSSYTETKDNFIAPVRQYILEKDLKNISQLSQLLDDNAGRIKKWGMIERYAQVFVNDEKKKVFYKNLVLQWYIDILKSDEYDPTILPQIRNDLLSLQDLDSDSYNDLLLLRDQYIYMLSSFSEWRYIAPKILFEELRSEGTLLKTKLDFPLAANALFSHYNKNGVLERDTEIYLLETFGSYTLNTSLSVEEKLHRYQYFSFFLEKQIMYMLRLDITEFSLGSFTDILWKHISILQESEEIDTKQRITTLYIYSDVLKEIDTFIREHYFLELRNDDELLVLNTINSISAADVLALDSELERIYDIYDKNKRFLTPQNARDQSISKDLSTSIERIREYFAALKNYESYENEYDISKRNLLSLTAFGSEIDTTMTEKKAREYLSQFEDVSIIDAKITIHKDYYDVSWAYLWWKPFNFELYPEEGNKLKNLVINSIPSPYVYSLDPIENRWREQYETASKQEKNQYDFGKFFYITFLQSQSSTVEEFVVEESTWNEDKTEIVFKRDVLLGEKWEFSTIRDIFPIEYDNIELRKKGTLYDIFIQSAPLSPPNAQWYNGVLDWEYVLSESEHYFEKIRFRIYTGAETNIRRIFENAEIQLSGRVQLVDFQDRITEVFEGMKDYETIYNDLENIGVENIVMQYSSRNQKMTFKFDLEGKTYSILVENSEIENIYRGTTQLISEPVRISSVEQYLK